MAGGHGFEDHLEGTLLEGLEDEVHRGAGEGAREGVRHRHAPHPRGQGRSHAVGGVLEDDATGSWNPQATGRQEEELRVGLDVCDVVAGDHDLDELPDAAAAQPALDPATGAARGHGPGEPEPSDLTATGRLPSWSEADFVGCMRSGMTPDGRLLDAEYMPWPFFASMTDDELRAMWRYLREPGCEL